MTKKVIYIVCLSHSGSTMLDLTLSRHPAVVGLGEVEAVLRARADTREGTESMCSCGEPMTACPLWSEYNAARGDGIGLNEVEQYKLLLEQPALQPYAAVVDSSKKPSKLNTLQTLHEDRTVELYPVFLVRDARGWATSLANRSEIRNKRRHWPAYYLYKWYRENRKIENYLLQQGMDFLSVGYEQLCFSPEKTVDGILEFAGLDANEFSLHADPVSHIAYGNRVKMDTKRRNAIIYDNRWMTNYWLDVSLMLMPRVFRWNRQHVYPDLG